MQLYVPGALINEIFSVTIGLSILINPAEVWSHKDINRFCGWDQEASRECSLTTRQMKSCILSSWSQIGCPLGNWEEKLPDGVSTNQMRQFQQLFQPKQAKLSIPYLPRIAFWVSPWNKTGTVFMLKGVECFLFDCF